jgi:ADP-dependent NAD(P)H-hydrate dehydratase / NAD(P)H-hydrate epimerase
MKIVSAAEMREIDRVTSERLGVPSLTLMENAGIAVAEFVLLHYPSAKSFGVVSGKGNNGGDGFVAARKLHDAGKDVRVFLLAEPSQLRGDAAEMFKRLSLKAVVVRSADELKSEAAQRVFEADVLVDAILGTGFRPPVKGVYADAIAEINASGRPVVAVDIPSGADADSGLHGGSEPDGAVVRAEAVVTFTAPRPVHVLGRVSLPTLAKNAKVGHEGFRSGQIVVAPIGSPPQAVTSSLNLNVIIAGDIAQLFAPRAADSNKGNFGHVLVVGGSLGKAGAAAMASIAVLRSGAGLCTVATAKSVLATVAGFHAELMTEPLKETNDGTISIHGYECLKKLATKMTLLAIGPGISRNAETSELVRKLVTESDKPLVLDADGLNAFEDRVAELNGKGKSLVITPHPGEMARLMGCSIADVQRDRIKTAREFAREHNLIVVLKGHRTLIAKPDGEVWVNTTGNPGMATGGTGDILTGITAGLVAQNPKSVFEAVVAAVHLHGLAGDVACETMGEQSLIATDLIEALPEAIRRIRDSAEEKFVTVAG